VTGEPVGEVHLVEDAMLEEGEDELGGSRQPGRLFFDVLLLAFSIVIVVSATAITTEARTMPLIIGWGVTIALGLQLVRDLLPARLLPGAKTAGPSTAKPDSVPGGAPPQPVSGERAAAVITEVDQGQGAEPLREITGTAVLWRQAAFAGWLVAFVALSALAGFAISVPVALLVFLRFVAGESWRLSLLVTAGTVAFFYLLFDLGLGTSLFF
jgi:hypothetical protein